MKHSNGVPNQQTILPSLPNVLGKSEGSKNIPLAQAVSNLLQMNNYDDKYQLYPGAPKTSVDKIVEEDMLMKFLSDVVDEYIDMIHQAYDEFNQAKAKPNPRNAGRKPLFEPHLIYKILALAEVKGLSDEAVIKQLIRQPSWCDLLGVTRIPSHQTLWRYRKIFVETDLDFSFFYRFAQDALDLFKVLYPSVEGEAGRHIAIDSTHVDAVWRRCDRLINKFIKQGYAECLFCKNVSRHVDTDATWSVKNHTPHFGFKMHAIVDVLSRIIMNVEVTTGAVNDVQMMTPLVVTLPDMPEHLYADNGYRGEEHVKALAEVGVTAHICKRYPRNKGKNVSLKDLEDLELQKAEVKAHNQQITPARRVVEFIFSGHRDRRRLRCIGLSRARQHIVMHSLTLNLSRLSQLILGKCKVKPLEVIFNESRSS